MPAKIFLPLLVILMLILILTSPQILRLWVPEPVTDTITPTQTTNRPTQTPLPTNTPDPFAFVPTVTPFGQGKVDLDQPLLSRPRSVEQVEVMPTVTSTSSPPTAIPTQVFSYTSVVLPDTFSAANRTITETVIVDIPIIPTPMSAPPNRLQIPRLNLDVPVNEVGLVPSATVPGVLEWEVPAYRAAGWLKTSAPLGQPGNTVLDGHHNVHGEVFRDLWTLETGDKITLQSEAGQPQHYQVTEVLILPERDQPLDVRLQNAQYIQPTPDERLTLVTCWPHNDNSHRTIVIAKPIK
ncbi:MAG: sortase [Chloroflexota bacterium]